MYEPIAGLAAEMSSPANVGVSTGAASGSGAASASAILGVLKLDATKLAAAVNANPEGVKLMVQKWSTSLNTTIKNLAQPGATLESRINGDSERVRQMKARIQTMNDMLALRKRSLEQTYAKLEGILSHNSALSSWLTEQSNQLAVNSKG
jgi:flagellar hook-associated protein 2